MVKENRGSGNEVGSGFPEEYETCEGLNFDIIKINKRFHLEKKSKPFAACFSRDIETLGKVHVPEIFFSIS